MARPRVPFNRLSRRLDALVRSQLWAQVLVALAAGVGVGVALGPDLDIVTRSTSDLAGDWLALPGRIFLGLIGMVIAPLAASSIILGIAGSGGGMLLKQVAWRMAAFVGATTLAATAIGFSFSRLLRPGGDLTQNIPPPPSPKPDLSQWPFERPQPIEQAARDLPDLISGLIPQNITVSLVEQDMLAIVVFSLFIGVAVLNSNKRELTRPLVAFSQAILEVCMTVIRTAMRFAPLAVFGLIAEATAASGYKTLGDLALYAATVLAGLAVLLALYLGLATTFGRISPRRFVQTILPVQLLAFSTSSSAAVMPLTMKTAVDKLSAPQTLAGAVIPLAATINMAGTALYQSVAVMFLAELSGTTLSASDVALIMATLTGASIGAPAAPGASVAILAATATSFGVPLTGLPLVMGIDRLLDMARTSVNVTGDLALTRILTPNGALATDAVNALPSPDVTQAKTTSEDKMEQNSDPTVAVRICAS